MVKPSAAPLAPSFREDGLLEHIFFGYRIFMQVSKWGNSLAIRLPNSFVEALGLKEGDEIEISVAGKRHVKADQPRTKEEAIESLRRLAQPLPAGFKFDREEANER